jgi:hypothetical protein
LGVSEDRGNDKRQADEQLHDRPPSDRRTSRTRRLLQS